MHLLRVSIAALLLLGGVLFIPLHAQTVTLKIIETTDVHGTIFPYDFINDRPARGSLAQVLTYVEQERRNDGQEVVLLDAGDILQGQPAVYYYNFERTDVRHLYARVMNYMRYDAAAVGNHDIETGHAVYDKFIAELACPWLAANAVRTEQPRTSSLAKRGDVGQPYFEPYTVIERKGVRIAVLGMVTPGIPNWLPPGIWQGMEFQDMLETARLWVPIIVEREKPDLLVGLFHAGGDYTSGGATADTPRNENASGLVAEQVPGFDIVFVGHDHSGWNLTVTNLHDKDVHILGASSYARDLAVATVRMRFDKEKRVWNKTIAGEIIDVSGFEPDSMLMARFAAEFGQIKKYVSRPIGRFTKTISTRDAMFGNSAFVDLIHRIQLELTNADVSITAPLSLDATIHEGQVYVRDMFRLYKYENLLYTMRLTGQEVKDFLEYSCAGWFNQMRSADDHLLNFATTAEGELAPSTRGRTRLNVPMFNFDSMAGLDYTVDVSRPAGSRVTIHAMSDGSPFFPDKTYTVAINSYRGNGGGGHLTTGARIPKAELASRILFSTQKDLRYFMMKWIEGKQTVTPESYGNWRVVPEDWWQAAKTRDFKLLYGERQP
ncbi:MAG: bifunctional metallophosphatase/5'-nucleotidase [bacterium]